MKNKDLDLVLFGATGFTGTLCLRYLKSRASGLSWATAGRDAVKLQQLQFKHSVAIEKILADSEDEEALDEITRRAKVVISTAGPFHKYSDKLVGSCLKNSCHYVDITGETFWVRQLIDKYHEEAAQKGIRIIPMCGYDSLPSDLGTFFAVKELGSPVSNVEAFHTGDGGFSGGTIETMFSMGELNLGDQLRDTFLLNPEGSVTDQQRKDSIPIKGVKKKEEIDSWIGPFIMAMANNLVVRRSAALMEQRQEPYGKDFTYNEYSFFKSPIYGLISTVIMAISGLVLFTRFGKFFRRFFPKPGEGPSEETMKNGFFEVLYKVEAEGGNHKIFRMHGKGDPGYRVTSKLVAESALTLLHNSDELPGGEGYGGVLTPATGLGQPLIDRLKKVGIYFEGPLDENLKVPEESS